MLLKNIRKTHIVPTVNNLKVKKIKKLSKRKYQISAKDRWYSSDELMEMEDKYSAHNYHSMPVVIDKAQGVVVYDPEGKKYFDFLSGYSALNQGHCHPKIIKALVDQASICHMTSRAFYNSIYPRYAKYMSDYFGYESILPMNTGAEAVDTALKIARKWGYVKKGIPDDRAHIISMTEAFHGRTFAAIALAQFESNEFFGPDLTGFSQVEYNNIESLREELEKKGERTCAVILEPIQGEAGVKVPEPGYLKEVKKLCEKHNVLMICDEVQTGIGRTGRMLAADWDHIRADMCLLGKAISGGVYPVSCVLADNKIMDVIKPGDHGSTYGGNPLACAVTMAALDVVKEENLVERSRVAGEIFRSNLREETEMYSFVTEVRGKGLLNAIELDPEYTSTAWDLCLILKKNGLLAKPTHENIIRFSPPLVITDQEMHEGVEIIKKSLAEFSNQ